MFGATNGRKWPEMVQNWPCEAPPASHIDLRRKIVKAKLVPNKNECVKVSVGHVGPCWGRKWPELVHLELF